MFSKFLIDIGFEKNVVTVFKDSDILSNYVRWLSNHVHLVLTDLEDDEGIFLDEKLVWKE